MVTKKLLKLKFLGNFLRSLGGKKLSVLEIKTIGTFTFGYDLVRSSNFV